MAKDINIPSRPDTFAGSPVCAGRIVGNGRLGPSMNPTIVHGIGAAVGGALVSIPHIALPELLADVIFESPKCSRYVPRNRIGRVEAIQSVGLRRTPLAP